MKIPDLAVLVAGGRSRRMGRDKCLLQWQEKVLWKHQLETLTFLHPSRLAVAAPECPQWLPSGVEWLMDSPADAGPMGGILAGLKSVKSGLVVALAVDLPRMTGEYLAELVSACTEHRGIVPLSPKGYEPIAAVYPAAAAGVAGEWLASGRRDLQGWVGELVRRNLVGEKCVGSMDMDLFHNWNRPEDLEGAG